MILEVRINSKVLEEKYRIDISTGGYKKWPQNASQPQRMPPHVYTKDAELNGCLVSGQ